MYVWISPNARNEDMKVWCVHLCSSSVLAVFVLIYQSTNCNLLWQSSHPACFRQCCWHSKKSGTPEQSVGQDQDSAARSCKTQSILSLGRLEVWTSWTSWTWSHWKSHLQKICAQFCFGVLPKDLLSPKTPRKSHAKNVQIINLFS